MDWKERKARREERRRRREEYLARPPVGYENHAKPVTRRDFLAHGLIDSVALVSMPPLLRALLSVPEVRAEAPSFLFPPNHVVVFINGTGGPGGIQQAAFVARGQGGEMMPASVLFEHGVVTTVTESSPGIVKAHGAWMYNVSPTSEATVNPFYGGLQTFTTPDILANMRAINAMTIARDDSDEGPAGSAGVVARTYIREQFTQDFLLAGGLAVTGGGNVSARQLASGLAMSAPEMNVEDPRLFQTVRDQNSIRNALDKPLGALSVASNAKILDALATIAQNLSKSRKSSGAKARAVEYQSNSSTTSRQTSAINGAFTFLDSNTVLAPATRTALDATGDAQTLRSAVSALFSGAVLPIMTYWKSGGDHHNQTYSAAATYATETAALIAALFCEADARTKAGTPTKVTVVMVHDGSYYAGTNTQNGNTGFLGDRGEYAQYVLLHHSPTPPTVAVPTLGYAINGYNSSGTVVGNQQAAALALVANLMYLFQGSSYRAEFARLVLRSAFDPSNLPGVECFG